MEEQIANQLAQRVGISREQAGTVITLVSKTLLQKAEPNKASGLLSKLPSSITSIFSDDEKQEFTKTQQNISNEQVIENIDQQTGINNKAKSQKATEEAVKMLQENTGEEGLMDNIMGKFKKMDFNPFD
jgi:uncharacterized protein (DUF2267 family)